MTISYAKMPTAFGDIYIAADKNTLVAITYSLDNWERIRNRLGTSIYEKENSITLMARSQLGEYFTKKRTRFTIPLRLSGTNFQEQAWKALLTIPYGETRSYSEQAEAIKRPKAVRAVGTANSRNPIGIIVPCHRVIGKSGKLGGYAGGIEIKEFLLRLEGSF